MNINELRNKLQTLQTKPTAGNSKIKDNTISLEPGKTVVRIIPYQFNKDNVFSEMQFHYDIGNRPYLSPLTYGRPDPIAEFGQKLRKTGSKEDWKIGKKLSEPGMRVYVPVLVRGKEAEGVKFWGFGKTIYEEILGIMLDEDYGDITDPISGRDLTIEYTLPNKDAGERYPKTSIRIKPNQSPISNDPKIVEDALSKQINLTELFVEPSYEELTGVLKEWLNPTPDTGVADATNSKAPVDVFDKPAPAASKPAAPKSAPSDVAAAFDDLFSK